MPRSIEAWIKYCKDNANKHGFYITWSRKDGPMNPIEALCKIISECSEAMEVYVSQPKNAQWKSEFESEIADILVRTYHMIGDLDIDIEAALEKKMKINKKRPHKHGKLT